MFGITKTRTAIFFGACGLIVVCILFEEDPSTKCTKPLPIPVSDSPKKYFAWPPPIRKIPRGEKFPWEKMKDTERERPSEVEERKFIWEHVRH